MGSPEGIQKQAENLYGQKKYKEAEKLFDEVVHYREKTLGKDHKRTHFSKDRLAQTLYHQGKYQEAEKMYYQLVQGHERALDKDHEHTLTGKYLLAQTLYRQGKYQEAQRTFQELTDTREKTLGKDHERTLTGKSWLARTLYQQGKYHEARRIFQELADTRERTLGKDHEHTLTGKSWMAQTLYQQGKYQEAQSIFQELANTRERTLGKGHEDTLASNQRLFQTKLAERQESQKAGKPFDKTVYGQEKITGKLAGMLLNENKYREAEEASRREIRARDAFLGKDDRITLDLKLNLAQSLLEQNRHQEAGSILQEVQHVRERTMDKDHKDTSASNQFLLQTKQFEEQYEAEERLRQKIRARDAFLGKDDRITLDLKLNLAQSLLEQNRHQEAGSIFQEVENIRERTLGKNSPADSVSLARSLPLVYGTTAISQKVQSPADSLPLVHGTTAISQEMQSPVDSLPLVHGTTAISQEVQSPADSLPLVHDTTAMWGAGLNTFFLAPTESRKPYNDSEISQISTLLRQTNSAWSRVPRTYIILRTIDCLHHLDELIDLGFSDYWLPVNQSSVPDCLSPKMRSLFLGTQKLILTPSINLEKGAKGHHCHFERGESLPFESRGVLGNGGFGQVDRILSRISFREYARKQVPRKRAFGRLDVAALKSIIGEIEAMKKLKHHHIVEFVGSYTDPKYLSVIMYPVAEQNLFDYLKAAGSANHGEIRTFFGCLATGLQFLHDRQIRHKDIKPRNILVDKGQIYLTDFGLSLDFEDATGSTTVGTVNFMTARYCAPEVALWEPRNTSSDIWSLGVVFLEMIVVLKGRTIDWMDDFLRAHGSHQTFIHSNLTGLEKLLAELKQTVNLSDNVALVWIQQILQKQHKSRPTAASLATSITQPYIHGGPDTIFCGICCLTPGDTDSDTSDDPEAENFLREFSLRTCVQ
ncbi:unnamed protein product [Penicillium crustosum]